VSYARVSESGESVELETESETESDVGSRGPRRS